MCNLINTEVTNSQHEKFWARLEFIFTLDVKKVFDK